jgi:two-component system, sensor histidine kinase and response regulator
MKIEDLQAELTQLKDEKYHLLKLINHDIRSPFNRIFALLQLFEMETGELGTQQKEYVDSMYLSILSGLEMIQNLRDMREIDAGHIEIEHTVVHMAEIIHKSIRAFSKQTELKNITIRANINPEEGVISTDEFYVQRIVENVLSNAVKFSKRGKEVIVNMTNTGVGIEISVQDFGEGVKHEEEHLLYQKFKKLSCNATGGEGCLGLGLHNTVYFLNRLNGTIRLERSQN